MSSYRVFIAKEFLVPATAEFTRKPLSEVQTFWNQAVAKGKLCTFTVEGEMPPSKRCAVCNTLARRDAMWCKTCGTEYAAYP